MNRFRSENPDISGDPKRPALMEAQPNLRKLGLNDPVVSTLIRVIL